MIPTISPAYPFRAALVKVFTAASSGGSCSTRIKVWRGFQIPRHAHVVDDTETLFVNGGRVVDQLRNLLARNFHVQNRPFYIPNAPAHLRHTIAGRDHVLCQFSAISCEERHHLEAECE